MFELIAATLGPIATLKLQRIVGGGTVYIPVAEDKDIERRNRSIRSACDRAREKSKPLPISKLMAEHDLSRRQIFNIIGAKD